MAVEVTRRRFTADEYQEMGRAGILREGDRVELIDGEVLAMSPIGAPHVGTLNRLNRLFVQRAGDTATVQVGGAIRLDSYSEPQPDLVLLKARADFYVSALPETLRHGAEDVFLPHHAGIEECQAGNGHHQHECTCHDHPCGVGGIDLGCLGLRERGRCDEHRQDCKHRDREPGYGWAR